MHRVPMSIVLDRITQFTYYFWKAFQSGLATKVELSTTFHPQMDGLAETIIQTLEDMLMECVIDFKGNWNDHLQLIKFAYNINYYSSISMAPFEALHGRRCRSPFGWFEVGEFAMIGHEAIYEVVEKVQLLRYRLKTAQSRQKSYAVNRKRDL